MFIVRVNDGLAHDNIGCACIDVRPRSDRTGAGSDAVDCIGAGCDIPVSVCCYARDLGQWTLIFGRVNGPELNCTVIYAEVKGYDLLGKLSLEISHHGVWLLR